MAELLDSLLVHADPAVDELLAPFVSGTTDASLHLGVFVEPYLGFMLDGSKTVESRFSINRCPPYGRVKAGDVILLKGAGRPVVGACRADYVWSYALDPHSLEGIRDRFSSAICAQEGFWASRDQARYATLIRVTDVQRLPDTQITKRDRRGWVVLSEGRSGRLL